MQKKAIWLILFLLAASLPFWPFYPPFWTTLLCYIAIYSLVVMSLSILTGIAGILSFGQAMFMGIGAYTTAIISTRYGISPWAGLPLAILVTALISWIIGLITLRLRGHYLPVVTIAWNLSFYYFVAGTDFFGRNDGINGIPPLSIFGYDLSDERFFWLLALSVLAITALITTKLLNSRKGRAVRALRGGVMAAESSGINTYYARIFIFVYCAVLASIAGWLYAHMQRAINPTPFSLNMSIEYLLMAVTGGVGYLGGAVLGAGLITIMRDHIQNILTKLLNVSGSVEIIAFGIILILILQWLPGGIWPLVLKLWNWFLVETGLDKFFGGTYSPNTDETHAAPMAKPMTISHSSAGSNMLLLENVKKNFGELIAVNNISFNCQASQLTAVIGPNGAGKSTIFNLITGVLPLSSGTITMDGHDITKIPARAIARLGVGRTFQHVKLVAGMNVLENVALGAHLQGHCGVLSAMFARDGKEEAVIMSEARHQIERVGLKGSEFIAATELALGQQRLVEIARALCLKPRVLLLDEPAAGLRHNEKIILAQLLKQLRNEGMAILLVEHDMEFVMDLADQIFVMNFGSKLAHGTACEIQNNQAVIDAYLGAE